MDERTNEFLDDQLLVLGSKLRPRDGTLSYDTVLASSVTGLDCKTHFSYEIGTPVPSPSLANQSQKEESDINEIVRRFGLTGRLPQVAMPPLEMEFAEVFDFQSAQNALVAADRSFMALPADVRARFGNDAGKFVAYCSELSADGKLANLEELRKMGLAVPEKVVVEPEPQKVFVVNDKGGSDVQEKGK